MSNLVKRLREVKDWWREPGRTAEQAADRIEALEAENKALRDKCEEQQSLLRSWRSIDFENGTEHDDALLEYCVDETRILLEKDK